MDMKGYGKPKPKPRPKPSKIEEPEDEYTQYDSDMEGFYTNPAMTAAERNGGW